MRRSSSGSWRARVGLCSRAAGATFAGLRRWASALATVPPCNEKSKDDMETAEAGGEEIVCPGGGGEYCQRAGGHETEAHDGDDGDGIGASGDDSGSVEEEPGGREGGFEAGALERES